MACVHGYIPLSRSLLCQSNEYAYVESDLWRTVHAS